MLSRSTIMATVLCQLQGYTKILTEYLVGWQTLCNKHSLLTISGCLPCRFLFSLPYSYSLGKRSLSEAVPSVMV